jgi:hypothetical protein
VIRVVRKREKNKGRGGRWSNSKPGSKSLKEGKKIKLKIKKKITSSGAVELQS